MKNFQNPPEIVKSVTYCICLLFDIKEDWAVAKKVLWSNRKLLENIYYYEMENV